MLARTNLAEDAVMVLREGGDSLVSEDHVHPNALGHPRKAEIFAAATRLGDL